MELQHSIDQPPQHSSFIEWAVARKEKATGPHKVLLPTVSSSPNGTVAALIDTDDCGEAAEQLAQEASGVLAEYTHQTLIELMARLEKHCHGSKGIAISALLVNTGVHNITWYGAGNVTGLLFRRNPAASPRYERLDASPERLGTGQCMLREMRLPIKPGDLIIFASHGVKENFIEALPIDGKPRVVADTLMSQYCDQEHDCAMVVVRYLGTGL